jgi:hypothetical protein
MATPTWTDRELPILEAIRSVEEAEGDRISSMDLAKMVGLPEAEVRVGVRALREAGYMAYGQLLGGEQRSWVATFPGLREKGRRAVQQWPSDGLGSLVELIEQRIADATDPEERSKLERLRDGLLGVGQGVATSIISSWLRQLSGLP